MSRVFAIIPAAGHSRRMGQPKLLLPWQNGLIIDAVLSAWTSSQVDQVVVITRRSDTDLLAACARWPVTVTSPETDPPDMKASIQHGIRWLQSNLDPSPSESDHWMVAPADLPTLHAHVIDQVIAAKHSTKITVPRFGDHESHPVMLPWSLAGDALTLTPDESLKSLLQRNVAHYVDLDSRDYASDVDLPEDYQRIIDLENGT